MSYLLVIGAKSDIAKAVARKYAANGFNLYLAARQASTLNDFCQDIKVRNSTEAKCLELDILDYDSHMNFYQSLDEKPIGVISVVGLLGEQQAAQSDNVQANLILNTNYTGVANLLNIIANDFEQRGSGFIIGVSSVAGDRGRKSNYIYGAAKSALTTYLSGLRNRLFASNVQVLTVKPGFVATQMTAGMQLPEKLTALPELVADDIYNAQQKKSNILYTSRIWRWIMLIIKLIPERIFRRLSI